MSFAFAKGQPKRPRSEKMLVEELETRTLLSAAGVFLPAVTHAVPASAPGSTPQAVSFLPPFAPATIVSAYGFNTVKFTDSTGATIRGTGLGQTIAIVDAFSDPNLVSDVAAFDSQFGLPAINLVIRNQWGGTTLPASNSGWGVEESLDVEWAHAIAPRAKIVLVEAAAATDTALFKAVTWAATKSGASVVSMSFGRGELSVDTSDDSIFTAPNVTYVGASGDNGAPGIYPAYSPNVVATGGTSLFLNQTTGAYSYERGWSGSGGGTSQFESKPAYQNGVNSTSFRQIPDASFLADPNTGVVVYDTFGQLGLLQVGGTSLATPMMAATFALVNQGRALAGNGPLSNMPADLYAIPASDYHDIKGGNNGNPAGPGYDLVTGIGTPRVKLFVADLVGLSPAVATLAKGTSGSSITSSGLMKVTVATPATALHLAVSGAFLKDPAALTPTAIQRGSGRAAVISPPSQQTLPIMTTTQHVLVDSGSAEDGDTAVELPVMPVSPGTLPNRPAIKSEQPMPTRTLKTRQLSVSAATDQVFAEDMVVLDGLKLSGDSAVVPAESEPVLAGSPVVLAGALALLAASREAGRKKTPALRR